MTSYFSPATAPNAWLPRTTRRLARSLAGVVLALVTCVPAFAADLTPEALVQQIGNDVLQAAKTDTGVRNGDRQQLMALVDSKVLPHVDFEKTTRLAAGRYWRQATPDQRKALVAEFESTLLRLYGGALSATKPQTVIEVRPARREADATDVVVHTLIRQPEADPVAVDYRLSRTGDTWKVYDFGVLNVWLIENYRNQFAQQIAAGGIEGLIKSLAAQNQAVRGSGAGGVGRLASN